jgi:ligand-binding SRPBCC domain-containing protein
MVFSKHSGIYTLEVKQHLPLSLESAWQFFSNPGNLEKITPRNMSFQITSALTDKVYEGQIITYKIGILPFFKTPWVTEITHIKGPHYFIDEQRIGPYKMWHHEHFFARDQDGVQMTDKVTFALPFSVIGHLAFHLTVKNQLKKIFEYRRQSLAELFGEKSSVLV